MTGPGIEAELEGARSVDFPLRGEWMAVHTPGSRIPSHGTDMLGQRYAFDLIRFDPRKGARYHPAGGLRTLLLGVPTRECHGWGEPVHAPLDGLVIAASDGLPERARIHPVRELLLVLKHGLTFRPTPRHLHRVLGPGPVQHAVPPVREGGPWRGPCGGRSPRGHADRRQPVLAGSALAPGLSRGSSARG
jgi:hypothetical protein